MLLISAMLFKVVLLLLVTRITLTTSFVPCIVRKGISTRGVTLFRGKLQDEDVNDGPVTKGFGGATNGGFGKKIGGQEVMKVTRSTVYREVRGQYARVLSAKSLSFEKIRDRGIATTFDIYVRASNSDVFWFVGKLNHDEAKISAEAALAQELPLIMEYAKSLRPKELSGPHAVNFQLEVYTTAGNNEMNVAQNKINLDKFLSKEVVVDVPNKTIASSQKILDSGDSVGFEPEIYQGGEDGFRVRRKEDGTPLKAAFEINSKTLSELEQMKEKGVELDVKKNL